MVIVEKSKTVIVKKSKMDIVKECKRPIIVLLHASWCGHCKTLMPEWKTFKDNMATTNENMDIMEIENEDGDKEDIVSHIKTNYKKPDSHYSDKKYDIESGFPTIIKLDKARKIHVYNGERESNELGKWAKGIVKKGGKRMKKSTKRRNPRKRNGRTKKH
jgi:thiol-disulfide isomerase/thioredoxin